ncbi:hypothetical protein SEA_BEAVER_6 [Gordonia phage Beaver]|uniref:Uncharacterized protein n=1 Tax=Gordonia phage Beaver TaxID=2591111 RepID=A0A515MJH4_9CAUD|nr:hypothetical protein HWC39_gp006 [Gordonia phage Beaver]QDM56821.1 hypothetical protein SEA_BEAVER_6 [Gordonia phage Beaver]
MVTLPSYSFPTETPAPAESVDMSNPEDEVTVTPADEVIPTRERALAYQQELGVVRTREEAEAIAESQG